MHTSIFTCRALDSALNSLANAVFKSAISVLIARSVGVFVWTIVQTAVETLRTQMCAHALSLTHHRHRSLSECTHGDDLSTTTTRLSSCHRIWNTSDCLSEFSSVPVLMLTMRIAKRGAASVSALCLTIHTHWMGTRMGMCIGENMSTAWFGYGDDFHMLWSQCGAR